MAVVPATGAVVRADVEGAIRGADDSPMVGGGMVKVSPCGLRRRPGLPRDRGDAGADRRAGASELAAAAASRFAGFAEFNEFAEFAGARMGEPCRGEADGEIRCDCCNGCADDSDVDCFWWVERAACEARAESIVGDSMAAVDAAGAAVERGGVLIFSDLSGASRGGVLNFSMFATVTDVAEGASSWALPGRAGGIARAGPPGCCVGGSGDENWGGGRAVVSGANDVAGVAKVGDARYS
jgi:hypothetical protein